MKQQRSAASRRSRAASWGDRVTQDRGSLRRLFPASVFVAAPYLALIVPVAIIQGNRQLPFILGVLGLALLGTLAAELALLTRRLRANPAIIAESADIPMLSIITASVLAVAALARVAFVASGGGSLLSQIMGQDSSRLASIAGIFAAWKLFAVGLLFTCVLRGVCRNRTAWLGVAILALIEIWAAFQTTITSPLIQFLSAVLLLALVLGLVRLRTLVVALVLMFIVWPPLYAFRNTLREDLGVAVDQSVSATDRLRFDEQIALVTQFQVPVQAGQPGATEILRYGLIPRFLDSGRPDLATSRLINRFVGGSNTSSTTFLSIGTLYFFYGPGGILVYYSLVSVVFSLLTSRAARAGPIALCLMAAAAWYLLGWASTFPDAIVGYIQAMVSFSPIAASLLILRRSSATVAVD